MRDRGNLRSWFSQKGSDEPTRGDILEAIGPHLTPDEELQHYIPGKAGVVHENSGTVEEIQPAEEGGSFMAVTDRQLVFAVVTESGEVVIDVPLIDVQKAEIESGFLKTTLSITVWNRGTYRFQPAAVDSVEDAVAFLNQASECWGIVDGLLDDLNVTTSALGEHIRKGRTDEAQETLRAANRKLDRAQARIEAAGLERALVSRVESARTDLHRTRIRALLVRAETLATEAKHQTDAGAYTGAYSRYHRARDHLETALAIAGEYGIEKSPVITAGLWELENRIENLTVQPMALAKQARERATTTDNVDVAVETWKQAFEHYRDALTAGWGVDSDFVGDHDDLRVQIETAVAHLIEARREYAAELEARGDEDREGERVDNARYRYEQALDQLQAAHQLSREFRAGDPERIGEERDRLASKLAALE